MDVRQSITTSSESLSGQYVLLQHAVIDAGTSHHAGHPNSSSRFCESITQISSTQNLPDTMHMTGADGDDCSTVDGMSSVCAARPMTSLHESRDSLSPQLTMAKFRNEAMLIAAKKGDAKLMELLLSMGTSIEVKDNDGVTPLMLAIVSRSRDAIAMLLNAGANIRALDNFNNTPLIYAATMDDVRHIYALRCVGVDVDARNQIGDTALCSAIKENNLYAVEALLAPRANCMAANPVTRNIYGVVPLFLALWVRMKINLLTKEGRHRLFSSLEETILNSNSQEAIRKNSKIFFALLKAGADANSRDSMGNTIEAYALAMDDAGLGAMLRDAGATPNSAEDIARARCIVSSMRVQDCCPDIQRYQV